MKRLTCALVLGLSCLAASQSAVFAQAPSQPAPTEEAGRRLVLRFLTDSDFPPFNYSDEDGVLAGFHVDLARDICQDMGVTCDIQARPWEELLPTLERGQADAVIAGHVVTAAALARVEFTDRYFHTAARFAGRFEGAKLDITPDGLDGKRIGVAKGTAHEAYLDVFFRDSSRQKFDSPELAREALLAGKVDLIFDDAVSLLFWLKGSQSKGCCEFKGGPFLEPKYFGDGVGIAVPKTDSQLRASLNTALRRLRASGRLQELVDKHFPQRLY